jgi:hypothetical protein
MIDYSGARGETRRDLARERTFVLARDRAPEQDFAAPHDHANLGGIDLAMAMHLVLDASSQLGIGW